MDIKALTKKDVKQLYEQSTPRNDGYRTFAFASHDLINAFGNTYEKHKESDDYNSLEFFFYDEKEEINVHKLNNTDYLPIDEGKIYAVSINCFVNTTCWETLGEVFKTEKGNLYFEDDFEEKYRQRINDIFPTADDCYKKAITLFNEYGEEHDRFPNIDLEFDTDLIGNPFDEVNSNPLAGHPYFTQTGYDSVNEYGTEIYERTVEIGTINGVPLYMDIRLRRNEKENFIEVDCAEGENKCWDAEDVLDEYIPVPDEIAQKVFDIVSERFKETLDKVKTKDKTNIERV